MLIEFLVTDSETFNVPGEVNVVEEYTPPFGGDGYIVFRTKVKKPEDIIVTDRQGEEWVPCRLDMRNKKVAFVMSWQKKSISIEGKEMKVNGRAQALAIYYKCQDLKLRSAEQIIKELNLEKEYLCSKYKSPIRYVRYRLRYSWDEKERKWKL